MSFIYIKIKLIEYDYKLLYSEWPKTPIVAIIITASQAQYFQNIGPRNVDTFCTATTARVNLISIVSPAYSSVVVEVVYNAIDDPPINDDPSHPIYVKVFLV